MMKNGKIFPQRGDIFWVDLNPSVGTEINKIRPCLIISNNVANEFSQRVIIVPLTSSLKAVQIFEIKVMIAQKTGKVLPQQIRAIDKIRLGKKMGSLTFEEMQKVDKALKLVLALS